jgi:RNA polymerase-binding transcription factor DksA
MFKNSKDEAKQKILEQISKYENDALELEEKKMALYRSIKDFVHSWEATEAAQRGITNYDRQINQIKTSIKKLRKKHDR